MGYEDSIILYNRFENDEEGECYVSTMFENARVELDSAEIARISGNAAADTCVLKIHNDNTLPKTYMNPIEWAKNDKKEEYFTFDEKNNNFFVIVKKKELNIDVTDLPIGLVKSNDYSGSFEQWVKENYGYSFHINKVSVFELIPHFMITGS